jgi:membrane fusion protein (multidrug efflux system)
MSPTMTTKAAIWALLCALATTLPACDGKAAASTEKDPGLEGTVKKRQPARVLVENSERREMVRLLETTTRVESERQVEIYPRASGVVTALFVEEGQTVTEGQVLASLDSRDAEFAVDDAKIALEEARALVPKLQIATQEAEARAETAKRSYEQASRDYARNESIAKSGPGAPALLSPKDLDASRLLRDNAQSEAQTAQLALSRAKIEDQASQTAVRRAELTLERAELELSYMDITAPFAGVLAERSIKVGDTLGASTAAFTITDPNDLRAVFYRPQRELPLFVVDPAEAALGAGRAGAEIEIRATAEARPGKTFRGTIQRIAPTIDPQSGNFRVTARLANLAEGDEHAQLLPGMLVRLAIVTERRPNALVVHKRALRREGDANIIFAVRDGHAVRIAIEERLSDDQYVEVAPLAGATLEPGEPVVVVGNRDLEDGAEVKIESSPGPAIAPDVPPSVAENKPADAEAAPAATAPPADPTAAASAPPPPPQDEDGAEASAPEQNSGGGRTGH